METAAAGPEEGCPFTRHEWGEATGQRRRELGQDVGFPCHQVWTEALEDMEPEVQAATHGILEGKEPATGPSRIPRVVVQRTQQPSKLEKIELLHGGPLLETGDELDTFAREHANSEGPRVKQSANEAALMVVVGAEFLQAEGNGDLVGLWPSQDIKEPSSTGTHCALKKLRDVCVKGVIDVHRVRRGFT